MAKDKKSTNIGSSLKGINFHGKTTSTISEEDILKSGEKKDRGSKKVSSPTTPVPKVVDEPVTESPEETVKPHLPVPVKPKPKVVKPAAREVIVEEESAKEEEKGKISEKQILTKKKKKGEAAIKPFIREFAKSLGCNVATDILGSDIAYWYPIGCAPLDIIFGGGVPAGKIIECFGWESSGKSTITLESVKAFESFWKSMNDDNYMVLWLESESALDKVRAQYMGCDLSTFLIQEVETVESGFDLIKKTLDLAVEKKIHTFICWDTIAAVLTENEKKGDTYGGGMGEKARMIRRYLKDISQPLGKTHSTMFFVNQMYKGGFTKGQPVSDEVPGGGGIRFHASIRMHMKRVGPPIEEILPSGQKITKGIEVELFTKKNKLTLPHQTCRMVINGESGIDFMETLSRFLVLHKFIEVRGSWKYIDWGSETFKFQNVDGLREILEVKSPELKTYMDYCCYKHYSSISPLTKVKNLSKLWELENTLYGKKLTKISDAEYSMASLLGRSILEEQDRED